MSHWPYIWSLFQFRFGLTLFSPAIFCIFSFVVFANLHFVVDFFDETDGRACIFGVGNGVDAAPPESDVISEWL